MFNVTDLIVDSDIILESGVDEISENQLANITGSKYRCSWCGKRFLRKEDLEDHKTAVKFREYQEEMFLDTERMQRRWV
ncbi:MAG: hypothetical protein KAX20_02990 [Candidatus Omnitrophica bacterium]|nr:hypothetical protein [Candidatus Omnitrophota bacterium]